MEIFKGIPHWELFRTQNGLSLPWPSSQAAAFPSDLRCTNRKTQLIRSFISSIPFVRMLRDA